jgi:hypothetical protein
MVEAVCEGCGANDASPPSATVSLSPAGVIYGVGTVVMCQVNRKCGEGTLEACVPRGSWQRTCSLLGNCVSVGWGSLLQCARSTTRANEKVV